MKKKDSGLINYLQLHLSIFIFSFTSVFTKLAATEFREGGLWNFRLYLFLFLMLLNCLIYAIVWQRVIKKFDLSIAYANKSVYLIWTQIWAVAIFGEILTPANIIGLVIVFIGVLVVQGE